MDVLEHPTADALTAFGLGKLGARIAAAIESHIADCAACRGIVDGSPPDEIVLLLRAAAGLYAIGCLE